MIYKGAGFLATAWFGSSSTHSLPPLVSKVDRRLTGRLRKRDNLLKGDGEGAGEEPNLTLLLHAHIATFPPPPPTTPFHQASILVVRKLTPNYHYLALLCITVSPSQIMIIWLLFWHKALASVLCPKHGCIHFASNLKKWEWEKWEKYFRIFQHWSVLEAHRFSVRHVTVQ